MWRRAPALVLCLAVMSGVTHSAAAEPTAPALTLGEIQTSAGDRVVLGNGGGVGLTLRYVENGRFALGLLLRNNSPDALTILDVRTPQPAASLVQQVGARFVPWAPSQCRHCPMQNLHLSNEAAFPPQPFELAAGNAVGVELDYALKSCAAIPTASAATAESFEVSYRDGSGSVWTLRLPIGHYRLALRMPKARDCSPDPRSDISVTGERLSTSSWWTVPGSAGDVCTRTAQGELRFQSRRFDVVDRRRATAHVLIHLRSFQGSGLYRSVHASARALGPASVLVAVKGPLGTLSVFDADVNIVTVLRDETTRFGGRFYAAGDGPGGRRFSVRGEWRCTTKPS